MTGVMGEGMRLWGRREESRGQRYLYPSSIWICGSYDGFLASPGGKVLLLKGGKYISQGRALVSLSI